MQTIRLLQAAVLMLLVAVAASCASGNSSVLDQFAKTYPPQTVSTAVVLKKDSASVVKEDKTPVIVKSVAPEETTPRAVSMNGTRLKKTRTE